MTSDPSAPLRLAVVAPGGYGKTRLLRELRQAYRDAGVPVVTDWPTTGADDWRRAVMLVDDAHLLPDTQLRMLREVPCPRMVIASRPWPRSPELAELMAPLDRAQLSTWELADVQRICPSAAATIHSLTGGVPRWTVRLAETGGQVTAAVSGAMRYELEVLDEDVVRYLIAARSGLGNRIDLLIALLGMPGTSVGDVMRAARATGLVNPDGTVIPLCGAALSTVVPAEMYLGVLQQLAELQLDRAEPVLPFARSLLGSGAIGSTVATVLATAAHEATVQDSALAAEMFGAAVSAGQPLADVVADWAHAAALSGDLGTALRLADQAILSQNRAGASISAAALAHRGQWARSAQLYTWAREPAFAQIASYAVGSFAAMPPTRRDRLPTALDGAAALMADGVRQSVSGDQAAALSLLVQAAALLEPAGLEALVPDTPAALAALVALHRGEIGIASSLLENAMTSRMGGDVMRVRHRLLLAWTRMARGQLGQATQLMDGLAVREPRDELFSVALAAGLARRAGDTVTLRRVWTQATACLLRHPVDLFTLLPVTELILASARLRDHGSPLLRDAFALLDKLGNPPLWAAPVHWAAVHAAILTDNPAAAEPHVSALELNPTPYGSALARAARCWTAVYAGQVEPAEVTVCARGLRDAGHWWESGRLASEAALRTGDRKAMVSLLDCARQLQVHEPAQPSDVASPLSDREQEVAELVVRGMTYKQIGDTLFISAKTVEHHMARIRQRLGATNRSELLAQLRTLAIGAPK
ncbi:helix-turn-helix transcriptional regulator [Kibdelosporangium phytohabitans]|uniref:helix-turn-helix transcriptional regulator n=1 Tax=Kibdelosporangium phytohabitans TaxID=860235 RepID=UPI001A055E78|nr:LuxR C-terminal-related transcriptional regulator [Kibdelosporangium phytohabitans]MBE1461307.1 DNA-binding CsgD family transcriptional regulator [Kibdelosporangium phytohabitans]